MKISVVIQARMSSERLPGKVLRSLAGDSILGHQVKRLRQTSLIDQIVIATSNEPSDDPLEEYARQEGISVVRGSLDNVAERFMSAIEEFKLEHIIRHCADRPFIDIKLIEQGIKLYAESKADIVTNAIQKRYPKGQTVEIFSAKILRDNVSLFDVNDDVEHVMTYFYKRAAQFKIQHLPALFDYSDVNLCIDTESDLEILTELVQDLTKPLIEYQWRDLADRYRILRDR
jgi:spore coat polysaccharide biosynthesis protein SpsF